MTSKHPASSAECSRSADPSANHSTARLLDEFTLFHLRWVMNKRDRLQGADQWIHIHSTPAWQAWSGYAFENVCFKHIPELKQALGISGVLTEVSSWRHRPTDAHDTGAQIDLLIDRRDGVINVCEMKFSTDPFVITKKYATDLRTKLATFRDITATRKALFLTLVTTQGVKSNDPSIELLQNQVSADALFG